MTLSQTLSRIVSRWAKSLRGTARGQASAQKSLTQAPAQRARAQPSSAARSGARSAAAGKTTTRFSWATGLKQVRRTLVTSPQRITRPVVLGTSCLLTLGVVLLEVSSAALFLDHLGMTALALVYGVTAVLGFGLRELNWVLSSYVPQRFRLSRLLRALAWTGLVAAWLGLCFGPPTLVWPELAGWPDRSALPLALGEMTEGLMGLQLLLLQCGAALLGQFHRAQIQGTMLSPLADQAAWSARDVPRETGDSSGGALRPSLETSSVLESVGQSWVANSLAWFTFGAYTLVGLVLPWCLRATGTSLPLVSLALGSGLLILLGAIPRLIWVAPAWRRRIAADEDESLPVEEHDTTAPRLLRRFGRWLLALFGLGQLLTLLIQWALWGQLQFNVVELGMGVAGGSGQGAIAIAAFLAWIQGIVGLSGLLLQLCITRGWFARHGAFIALAWSPLILLGLSVLVVREQLPLLWGLALLRGLDQGLQYSWRHDAERRLLDRLPRQAIVEFQQRRIRVESLVTGLLGVVLLLVHLGWRALSTAQMLAIIAGLSLVTLMVLVCLRYRYFQLILGVIEQQVIRHRFPHAPLEQLGSDQLLKQPSTPLMKRGLVKALKRSLKEPVQLETAIVTVRLLDQLAPLRAVEILAPALVRLPPLLQLEGLTLMTRLGRESVLAQQGQVQQPSRHNAKGQKGRGRKAKDRTSSGQNGRGSHLNDLPGTNFGGAIPIFADHYQPQRYLRSVAALMTPIAPTAVFAAALRYSLYLGPRPLPKSLRLYLQPERAAAVRAVAAAFALNPALDLPEAPAQPGTSSISKRLAQSQWSELVPQARATLQAMLVHEAEEERLAASESLVDLADLTPFKEQIPALLEDFSPRVREAVIAAIAQTRSQSLYPYLLKALRSPLVEQPAHEALVQLGDAAIPLLQRCTQHPDLSLDTKERSWCILAEIGSDAARFALAEDVLFQQGQPRQRLLTLLLAQPRGASALDLALAGSEGVMQLVREELWLLSHLYAGLVDLHPKVMPGLAARQLRQALTRQQRDVGERVLLLLQIRYPEAGLQRVVQQLRHRATIPQGLQRLGQLLEPPLRDPLLAVFDARPVRDKHLAFQAWQVGEGDAQGQGEPDSPSARLRQLIALEPGLDRRALAGAYELALEQGLSLDDDNVLRGMNHGDLAVRAAAQAYLNRMPESVITALLEMS